MSADGGFGHVSGGETTRGSRIEAVVIAAVALQICDHCSPGSTVLVMVACTRTRRAHYCMLFSSHLFMDLPRTRNERPTTNERKMDKRKMDKRKVDMGCLYKPESHTIPI